MKTKTEKKRPILCYCGFAYDGNRFAECPHKHSHQTKTKTESKHTPTPWKYEPGSETIRSVPANYWIATVDSWDKSVDNEENAAYIVDAVNSHEALLEVKENLKGLLAWIEDTRMQVGAARYIPDSDYLAGIRRAIAKAEEVLS